VRQSIGHARAFGRCVDHRDPALADVEQVVDRMGACRSVVDLT
jgi:hypothetical protein